MQFLAESLEWLKQKTERQTEVDMAEEDTSGKGLLTLLKTVGDLIKQYGLLLFIVLLVFNPPWVKDWAQEAGIRKVGDLEFTPAEAEQVEKTEQDLNEAKQAIARLSEKLTEVERELQAASAAGAAAPAQLEQALADTGRAIKFARNSEQQMSRSLTQIQPLARKAESLIKSPTGDWAVVFGGDVSLEAAGYEVRRLTKAGVDAAQVAVYLRESSYRTVAVYPTREEAEQGLALIRGLRSSAYVVPFGRWCPRPVAREGYLACE